MENLIYEYLIQNCVGYDNRVKGRTLMKKFGINDHKTLRSYIQYIRKSPAHPRLIGSEAGSQGGYWIITNKKELDTTVYHMYLRAKEIEKECKILEKKARKKERGF